jgi:hypothetical protein
MKLSGPPKKTTTNPLGRERFEEATRISQSQWYERYWSRWGDAVREAEGFKANILQVQTRAVKG